MESSEPTDFIALFGEWNTTNLGDQAIGKNAVRYFLNGGFGVKLFAMGSLVYLGTITHFSQEEELFQRLFDGATIQQNRKADQRSSRKRRLRTLKKHLTYLEHSVRFVRNQSRWENIKAHLFDCRVLVVGGGDLLNEQYRTFLTPLYFITAYSKTSGIPLACLGCSGSSSFSGLVSHVVRDFIRQAYIVSARDQATRRSLEKLTGRELTLFGDFALEMPALRQKRKVGKVPAIAINVMAPEAERRDQYEQFLGTLITRLTNGKRHTITLFTTGNAEDKFFMEQLLKTVPEDVAFFHPAGLKELESFYHTTDLVIATRLHAAIIAMSQQTSAVAISITPKIRDFFETVGLSDYYYPLTAEGAEKILTFVNSNEYEVTPAAQVLAKLTRERKKILDTLAALTTESQLIFAAAGKGS